jgi:type II and III secretion system protein
MERTAIMKTNRKIIAAVFAFAALLPGLRAAAEWDKPTPSPLPTQVLPLLNVEVNRETDAITFVNTNNDPFVYTRVYVLKHADPYEIRPFIMAAVRSRRVDTNDTKVEAIRYMDGTGMLIVSAEQYRFEPVENGMSIDQIVEMLDKPGLASETGRKFFLYYPKYWDSATLAALVRRVGMTEVDDDVELQGGIDTVRADVGLNALMFHTSPFSQKAIERILKEYDAPVTEALVDYKIYEIDSENDGNLGVDFQAWKNGPGADLFAAGARYASGWDFLNNNVASNLIKSSHTSAFNFNPKWNSKYLDFLVAKSKAKVITSGRTSIMNRCTGTISSVTRIPVIEAGEETAGDSGPVTLSDALLIPAWNTDYTLNAVDQEKGLAINIRPAGYTGEVVITRTKINTRTYYNISLDKSGAYLTRADGKNLGRTCKAYDVSVTLTDNTVTPPVTTDVDDWTSAYSYTIRKDKKRVTKQAEFGFTLELTPEVNTEASQIKVAMSNTNLLGFKGNGEPRTSETVLNTSLQMANDGGVFYIGGLEKSALVRSVSKVPFLGDIPFLGWVFSGESESVKKTQIVAVLTVVPVTPDTPVDARLRDEAGKTVEKLSNFGLKHKLLVENEYGFDQYFLDPDKD